MLTALQIKAAERKPSPYKLTDRDGLHVVVLPSGARSWRYNYLEPATGRPAPRPTACGPR